MSKFEKRKVYLYLPPIPADIKFLGSGIVSAMEDAVEENKGDLWINKKNRDSIMPAEGGEVALLEDAVDVEIGYRSFNAVPFMRARLYTNRLYSSFKVKFDPDEMDGLKRIMSVIYKHLDAKKPE